MSTTSYLEVQGVDRDRQPVGSLLVELRGEGVGDRVTGLTRAARAVAPPDGVRLRVEVGIKPPGREHVVRPLTDYLWADDNLNAARFQRHLQRMLSGRHIHTYRVHTVVVSGDDLVGREAKVEELLVALRSGSCHLRAPRRYGKTSLLRRVAEELPGTLRLDLGHEATVDGLVAAILREARRCPAADQALRGTLDAWPPVDSSDGAFDEALSRLLAQFCDRSLALLMQLLDRLARAGVVMLLDEFSLFLRTLVSQNEAEASQLLAQSARLRKRKTAPLRWLVAGSTGLSAYIRFRGLGDVLGDLTPIDVGPLDNDVARLLAEELFYGASCWPTPAAVNRVVEHAGAGITLFLHALVNEILDEPGPKKVVTPSDVDRAYYGRLLGSAGSDYLKPFRVDDRPYPEHLRKPARTILATLARSAGSVSLKELEVTLGLQGGGDAAELEALMTCLEEDYDLKRDPQGWSMRCKVLADLWRRR